MKKTIIILLLFSKCVVAQTKVDTSVWPSVIFAGNVGSTQNTATSNTFMNLTPAWWTITNTHELLKVIPRNNKPDFSDGAIIIINKKSHIKYINKYTILITN